MERRRPVRLVLFLLLTFAYFLFVRVPYAALAKAFSMIEATTKRLEKNAILTAFLLLVIERSGGKDHMSLLQAVYLCINRVSKPPFLLDPLVKQALLAESRLHWY
jgi:hypothetical protein